MVDELKSTKARWENSIAARRNKTAIERWSAQIAKLNKAKKTCDVVVLDPILNRNCMQFYSTVCEYVLYQMEGRPLEGPFINKIKPSTLVAPDTLSALPVWYIEDIAEYLIFCMQ